MKSRIFIIWLVFLTLLVPNVSGAQEIATDGDTRSAATALGLNGALSGEVHPADDVDWFRLDVPAPGGVLTVYTEGALDTWGAWYDAGGRFVTNNNDGGEGSNFRIERAVTGGTYYVRVTAGSTGSYTIRNGFVPAAGPDAHGNTRSAATALGLNGALSGEVHPADDVDWFRLDVPAPGGVLIVYTEGALNTWGAWYDAGGRFVTNNNDGGEGFNFRIERAVTGGTYYVRVTAGSTGSYTIRNGFVPAAGPDAHGNTRSAATALGLNGALSGEVHPADDVDWFRLDVPAPGGVLTVYTEGGLGTWGALYDAGGRFVTNSTDGGEGSNFRIERAVTGGTYYVRVTAGSTGSYTIRNGFVPTEGNNDHGDTRSAAAALGLNGALSGEIYPASDKDWFRLDVPAPGGVLTVYTEGALDTYGELYDAGGKRLADNVDSGAGNNFRIERAVAGGTYYVRVSWWRGPTGRYTIHSGFAPAGAGDDHGNVRSSATALALHGSVPGAIGTAYDEDWFRVEVTEPGILIVYTEGTLNTFGELHSADGVPLSGDHDSGAGRNFRIERAVSPGRYFVGVKSFGTGTGTYTVRSVFVEGRRLPPDEHGNTHSSATALALHGSVPGAIGTAYDEDWFRVEVTEPGILIVYTEGTLNTFGELHSADGVPLSGDHDSGAGRNFRIERAVSPGRYYVGVKSFGTATGTYTVRSVFISDGGQHSDNGDTRSAATALGLNGALSGEVHPADDVDWFRLDVPAPGGVLTVYTEGALDTWGAWYDAGGRFVTNSTDGGEGSNFRIERAVTGGTYYVRVTAGSTGSYTIRNGFVPAAGPDAHGNTRSAATALGLNGALSGEVHPADDVDWFRLDVPAPGGVLTVYTEGALDTWGAWYDAGGRFVTNNNDGGEGSNFRIERAVTGGTYYVRVTAGSTGSYTIRNGFVPAAGPDAHGNTRSAATALGLNGALSGEVHPADDVDWFRLDVPAPGGVLTVYTEGGLGTWGALYDAGGRFVTNSTDGGEGSNFRIERAVTGGTYYVRVTAGSTGSYTIRNGFVPTEGNNDHGDTRSAAAALGLNGALSGEIYPASDKDWFRLDVPAPGGVLTVYTEGALDTYGELYDAGGKRLADNVDSGAGNNFRIERAVAGGTYYVRVSWWRGPTGRYTIHSGFAPAGAGDDHGNVRSSATALALHGSVPGAIGTAYDEDWFRVEVTEPGILIVYTEGTLNTFGELHSADGVPLSGDHDSGAGRNFRIERAVSPGRYFVGVKSFGTGTGTYTVRSVFVEGRRLPPDEHGNTHSSATALALHGSVPGAIGTAYDEDWFRVEVTEPGILIVYTEGTLNTFGELHSADGVPLSGDHDSGAGRNFRIERAVSPGRYYVGVKSFGTATGTYTVRSVFISDGGQHSDNGDTRSAATALGLNGALSGEVHPADDVDWFRLDVPAPGGVLTVYTEGALDTWGAWYDAGGRIVTNSTDGGEGSNFRIERAVTGGTYYVVVGSSGSQTGRYTIRNGFVPAAGPDAHGDTRSAATALGLNGALSGEVHPADDEDWFRLDVPAPGGVLTVYTEGALDTWGAWYDAGGRFVTNNNDGGEGSNFRIERAVTGGTYYVRVTAGSTGSYTIRNGFVPAAGPDAHGDTRSAATALGLNGALSGEVHPADDVDWFRLDVPAPGGVLTVYTEGGLDTWGAWYDAGGRFVTNNNDGGEGSNFRIERAVTGGTYYVRVTAGSTGSYTIRNGFVPAAGPDAHGNSRETATRLSPGGASGGTLTSDDEDWFRLDVQTAKVLTVDLAATNDVWVALEDENGFTLAVDIDGGKNRHVRFEQAVGPGSYYIRVTKPDDRVSLSYWISTGRGSGRSADDHGDERESATVLTLNGSLDGAFHDGDDKDWFRFDVATAGILTIELAVEDDVWAVLEYDNGRYVAIDTDGGRGRNVRFEQAVEPGSYYLWITPPGRPEGFSYSLTSRFVAASASGPDSGDRQDARAGAAQLSLNGAKTATFDAVDDASGHVGWFRLDIPAPGGLLTVYTEGALDTWGELQDAGGRPIASNDDSGEGANFRIERAVTAGTHYVRVIGSRTGPYTIRNGFVPATGNDDHGNTDLEPTALVLNGALSMQVDPADVDDRLRIDVPAPGGLLTVYTEGVLNIYGILEDARGGQLAYKDNGPGGSFRIDRFLAPGTYWLVLRNDPAGQHRSYTIHSRFVKDDHSEEISDATRLPLNGSRAGAILATEDEDWFRIDVTQPGRLEVYTDGPLAASIVLHARDGERLTWGSASKPISHSLPPGIYYVSIRGKSGSTGSYTLHNSHAGLPDTKFLKLNTSSLWTITPTKGWIEGWFEFRVDHQGSLTVHSEGTVETVGRLFDGAGQMLAVNGGGLLTSNFRIERRVSPGTYYLELGVLDPGEGASVRLNLEFDEHGDDRRTATGFPVNSSLKGSIVPGHDHDYFRIEIKDTGTLTVYTEGDLNTEGELQDRLGTVLSSNNNSSLLDSNFLIEHKVVPGTYYVKVNSRGLFNLLNEPVGGYTLHNRFAPDDDGGTRETATRLVSEEAVTRTIRRGDIDYFRIELGTLGNSVGNLTIEYTDNVLVELQNATGKVLQSNEDVFGSFADIGWFSYRAFCCTPYYIKVTGNSRDWETYELRADFFGLGVIGTQLTAAGIRDLHVQARQLPDGEAQSTDRAHPAVMSIARSAPGTAITNADVVTWRVAFGEAVTAVNAADFAVAGTSADIDVVAAQMDGMTPQSVWEVTASGGDLSELDGIVRLEFAPEHDIADLYGNPLVDIAPVGANDNWFEIDNTPPTVTITVDRRLSAGGYAATFTFSEPVADFSIEDIVAGHAVISGLTSTEGGRVWQADVSAAKGALSVPAGVVTDTAGNGNLASERFDLAQFAHDDRRHLEGVLASFDRAMLHGAVDMIGRRFDAAPTSGAKVTVAGEPVFTSRPAAAGAGVPESPDERSWSVDRDLLIRGSTFALSPEREDGHMGGDWTVWGRGDVQHFVGATAAGGHEGTHEGTLRAGWFGVDFRRSDRLLAGIALSTSHGKTRYRRNGGGGNLDMELSAVWPYLQVGTREGRRLRFLFGAGLGEVEHRTDDNGSERSDLSISLGSVSGVWPAARFGVIALSATGDIGFARLETDDNGTLVGGLDPLVWQTRGGVQARHDGFALMEDGPTLAPYLSVSLRHDGGDGQVGSGLETMAGFTMTSPASRFSLGARGRWVALHSAGGLREWGASFEASLAPDSLGRGFSWSFGPQWGAPDGGTLAQSDPFAASHPGLPGTASLAARTGYGFGVGPGTATPFLEAGLSQGASGSQRFAGGLTFRMPAGLELSLTGQFRDHEAGASDRRVDLSLGARF